MMQITVRYPANYWRNKAEEYRKSAYLAAKHGWIDFSLNFLNESYLCDHYAEQNGEDKAETMAKDHERREASEDAMIETARANGNY